MNIQSPMSERSTFELKQRTDGRYQLCIAGYFRSGWMATLCNGLAARKISIDAAQAWRRDDRSWYAELTLTPLLGAADPRAIAYLELVENHDTIAPHALEVDRCRVHESAEHGGSLLLSLEAEDALGLLGSILASLATQMLFPVAMEIQTQAGRAEDRLWLTGIGGTPPTPSLRENLDRLIATWRKARN